LSVDAYADDLSYQGVYSQLQNSADLEAAGEVLNVFHSETELFNFIKWLKKSRRGALKSFAAEALLLRIGLSRSEINRLYEYSEFSESKLQRGLLKHLLVVEAGMATISIIVASVLTLTEPAARGQWSLSVSVAGAGLFLILNGAMLMTWVMAVIEGDSMLTVAKVWTTDRERKDAYWKDLGLSLPFGVSSKCVRNLALLASQSAG